MASTSIAMLSLLPRRAAPCGSLSRCLTAKRSHSILAATASNNNFTTARCSANSNNNNDVASCRQHRWFSKYASVDHSAAYQEAIASNHGTQLQLALEEGRGKDDAPFDPFSQFLDQMGTTVDDVDGANNDDGDDVIDGEGIEEAEYKTIEEYDDNQDGEQQLDDDESDDDEEDEGPVYTNTGALYRPKSERLALRAGYPAGGKFAVILLAGKQHKVTHDDLLVVNKLKPVAEWAVGSTHTLKSEDVLLMADKDKTLVGLPGVQGGEVDVMVEEITRDKTLIIFKKRRRKHSRRKNGFRRQVTFLRVLDVRMPGEEAKGAEGNDIDAGMEGMSMAA